MFTSNINPRGGIRGSTSWRQPRGTPYSRARGRGGRSTAPAHRNRTLVLNGNTISNTSSTVPQSGFSDLAGHGDVTPKANENEPPPSTGSWVAKRDRHMQLINTSIYDKDTQSRVKAIQETRRLKAQQRDEREKFKINKHIQRFTPKSTKVAGTSALESTHTTHEVTIDGIQFRVTNGGSKLVRAFGTQARFLNYHSCLLTSLSQAVKAGPNPLLKKQTLAV